MKLTKVTPIYYVDRIEPALAFYAALGFEKTVEVKHGDRVGFVILVHAERELMLQTRASLNDDLALEGLEPACALYCDVDSLAGARAAAKGARVLVAERSTPYGALETWVLDPSGTLVGFAEHRRV